MRDLYNNPINNGLYAELSDYFKQPEKLKTEAERLTHHIKLNKDFWGFTQWKAGDISFDRYDIIRQNEKVLNECFNDLINGLNTSPKPIKFESLDNVILIQGIKESIDRDIGAVSTALDYSSLGSSSTSESESQTDLITEFTDIAYARLQFSVSGSRTRTNQTMKLGMLWDETSFDSVPKTIRESGVHWHLSAASKCHARVVSTDFSLDSGDLFVVQINELQENGTL